MNTTHLSQTLLASWRQRDREAPWARWLLSALVVLPAAAAAIWMEGPLARILPTAMLVVAVYIGWMVVAANLQMQNDPAAARLVPGHVRALQHAALAGWGACTAVATLLLWLGLPPYLSWQSLLLGTAAAATFALWASRLWWLWLVLCVYSPLIGVFRHRLDEPMQAVYAVWAAHTNSLLLLGLLAMAALVPPTFGHGNERHRRAHERLRRIQEVQRMVQEGRQATPAQAFASLERFSRPFDLLIGAWRRHVVATANNARLSSVMARAELVLHANQHWTYQVLAAVVVVLVLGLSIAAVVSFTPASLADMFKHGAFGIAIGLASMAANPTVSRPTLWQTRREQALLKLLPGMPQGAAMNRAVAWIALRHALVATALVSLLLVPLARVSQQWGLLWLPVAAVPWALWTATRSPARMRPPTALTSVLPVFGFYAVAGAGYVATERFSNPMAPWAGAILLASLAWGLVRWRQLDGQPPALPTGRLS